MSSLLRPQACPLDGSVDDDASKSEYIAAAISIVVNSSGRVEPLENGRPVLERICGRRIDVAFVG